jgi:hypothetical protein
MKYKDDYPIFHRSNKIPTKGGLCRSPIELKYFKELDNDEDVLSYLPEPFKIPYQYDNKDSNYIPDVLIHYASGMIKLVEVKVLKEVPEPRNIAKFNAAKEYAKNNGMEFKIIVRHVQGSRANPYFDGEYDDHTSVIKLQNRWLYKRIIPPLIIFAALLLVILVKGGIGNAFIFIFGVCLLLFSFMKVMSRS